jgi:hypothetical protein
MGTTFGGRSSPTVQGTAIKSAGGAERSVHVRRIREKGFEGVTATVTDRALRYRAVQLIPNHPKVCAFCGALPQQTPMLVGHVDGREENLEPDNLTWTCRSCNSVASNTLQNAGLGRRTRQFNPTKSGGASNIGEWMQAVGAITPHVNRGDRGLVSSMSVPDAVAMIRATPHSKRSEFASRLRHNPARQNLFGIGSRKSKEEQGDYYVEGVGSFSTLTKARAAAQKEANELGRRVEVRWRKGFTQHQNFVMPSKSVLKKIERETKPQKIATYRGYKIERDADGDYYSSFDPSSRFETLKDVRKHIDWYVGGRGNPSKFDRCVKEVKKRGGAYDPYAVCTAAGTRNPSRSLEAWLRRVPSWMRIDYSLVDSVDDLRFQVQHEIDLAEDEGAGSITTPKRMATAKHLLIALKQSNPSAFDKCVADVTKRGGARDPRAVCGVAGRRKYGQAEMTARSVASRRKAKRNPADGAVEVFEEFHGHAPDEIVTVEKKVHFHKHLAGAGELKRLVVKGIDGETHTITGFKGAILAFNEEKNQLFVEGGDQSMNLEDFGIRHPHELETLGKIKHIDYFTTKDHLGDEGGEATYTHQFRTTNQNGEHVVVTIARYPDLIYRVRDEQLEFSGGSYTIRAEGIDK